MAEVEHKNLRNLIEELGDKFKERESEFIHKLNPRKYTIIRLDGHKFSTLSKGYSKPLDERIANAMLKASANILKKFAGTVFVYTESDEITVVFDRIDEEFKSEFIFGGRIEKILTYMSGYVSSAFNHILETEFNNLAYFDARIFQVEYEELSDVIYWRQLDALRNGVMALARTLYSKKQMEKISVKEAIDMLKKDHLSELNRYIDSALFHGLCIKKIMTKENRNGIDVCRTSLESVLINNGLIVEKIPTSIITNKYWNGNDPKELVMKSDSWEYTQDGFSIINGVDGLVFKYNKVLLSEIV